VSGRAELGGQRRPARGGGLVRELLGAGEQVVFVPPRLTAGTRRGGRERGKSDPIDALAVTQAALREEGQLPPVRLHGPVPGGAAAVGSPRGPGRRANPGDQPAALDGA